MYATVCRCCKRRTRSTLQNALRTAWSLVHLLPIGVAWEEGYMSISLLLSIKSVTILTIHGYVIGAVGYRRVCVGTR
jgi:hypothetical protein